MNDKIYTINSELVEIFHECSYCGGWKEKVRGFLEGTPVRAMQITSSTQSRVICQKCLIELFDSVLGEPYQKEGNQDK